jgi:hypothetical protein
MNSTAILNPEGTLMEANDAQMWYGIVSFVFALLPTIPYIAYSDIVDGTKKMDCWYDYKLKETKCVSEDDNAEEEKDKTEDTTVDCTYDRISKSLVCKND